MRRALGLAILLSLALPASGTAFTLMEGIVPQPKKLYFVTVKDWRKPMKRIVRVLNRAKVGVKLVEAEISQQASIQIGRLDRQCGQPGVDATTLNLEGGYAVMYLPRNCSAARASIVGAHELGHALGLLHEDGKCALMNSSGTGPKGVPTRCLGQRIPWKRKPFRKDDLKGLRKLYRNTPPIVSIRLTGGATIPANSYATFDIDATDKQDNLSIVRVEYGDGSPPEEAEGGQAPPNSHYYTTPGTYEIKVTAIDFYGKRDTASVTVTVI